MLDAQKTVMDMVEMHDGNPIAFLTSKGMSLEEIILKTEEAARAQGKSSDEICLVLDRIREDYYKVKKEGT
jgi:hypothetical protein